MITHEELLEVLHYDKETGFFTWKKSSGKAKQGAVAGFKHKSGYIYIRYNGKQYSSNRLAWFYVHNKWPIGQIIHINNINDDNRFCNLKHVSYNSKKQKEHIKPYLDNRSNKWLSHCKFYGKSRHIGWFDTEQEAREAIINYRRELENQGVL